MKKKYVPIKLEQDFKKRQQSLKVKLLTDFMIDYCKCWNNLDTSFIEPYLDENVQYKSKWVNCVMIGKKDYLEYMNGKFKTLRKLLELYVKADAGYIKGDEEYDNGKPCVIIMQKINGRINHVVLVFTGLGGKITHIKMQEIPEGKLVDFGIYYA